MKIGIDAKWYFSGPVSGRVVIRNLLKELLRLYPEFEWHIFFKKHHRKFPQPFDQPNVKIHYVGPRLNLISNLFTVPKLAKDLELDAVLFQTFSPASKSFRSLVLIHDILFHDYPEFFSWRERLYFLPIRRAIRLADRIITPSEFVRSKLYEFNYARKDQIVDVAPLGVTENFRPCSQQDPAMLDLVKKKFHLPDHYLLFVGRMNERKNLQNLIKSLSFVKDKKIALVIAGEKDWKIPSLDHLLKNKEISDRIIFTGAISDAELPAIYAMAKIFCYPSYAEGFGLPPLEAVASGIPVVVSKTTSMPEVCGPAALYIDPNNPGDIAEKINILVDDELLYKTKSELGLEWSKKFTWKKTAGAIMKSILETINNPIATAK